MKRYTKLHSIYKIKGKFIKCVHYRVLSSPTKATHFIRQNNSQKIFLNTKFNGISTALYTPRNNFRTQFTMNKKTTFLEVTKFWFS